jgi:hypothetical protein
MKNYPHWLIGICTVIFALPVCAQLSGTGDQLLVLGDLSGQLQGVPDGSFGQDGMVAGDLDCDGRDDLVVQQPSSLVDTGGGANFIAGGQVTVIRTNGSGFPQPGGSFFLHQAITNVPGAVEAGDGFGRAATIFDFNADGCDDLFIGVPGEDVSGVNNAGAMHGFLGIAGVGPSTTPVGVVDGTIADEALGTALSFRTQVGSVRLYVGRPGATSGSTLAVGRVSTFNFSSGSDFLNALNPFDITGTLLANDRWGSQMAANDGGGILAVRSPRASATALVRPQPAAVLALQRVAADDALMAFGDFDGDGIDEFVQQFDFGGLAIWRRTSASAGAVFALQQTVPVLASGSEFISFTSIATGDFNADGFSDLALGYPGNDLAGLSGRVAVAYGSNNGLQLSNLQILRQGVAGLAGTADPLDEFGASLASGDFNGDGVDDLAVGVPGEFRGATLRGGVHFILGVRSPLIFANGFE